MCVCCIKETAIDLIGFKFGLDDSIVCAGINCPTHAPSVL